MKIFEIINEDVLDEIIEDEANDPVINYLIEILESLQARAYNFHKIPRVRADSLINLVQMEHPQFNLDILQNARTNNTVVKDLIKDIKDDATGIKYVYITQYADDADEESKLPNDETAPKTAPEKTVDSMAKSALAKRS